MDKQSESSEDGEESANDAKSHINAKVENTVSSTRVLSEEFFGIPTKLPESILNIKEIVALLGFVDNISADCDKKNLPARKVQAFPKYTIKSCDAIIKLSELPSLHTRPSESWSAEMPFEAKILDASWLTQSARSIANIDSRVENWGKARRVVHMEIDLGDSKIQYLPGDSFGVMTPNPDYLVQKLLAHIQDCQDTTGDASASGSVDRPSVLTMNSIIDVASMGIFSLRELLTYKLDLCGVPRKNTVYALSQFCTDSDERRCMEWLCSKCPVGKELWQQFIEEQRLGFGELLLLFPSCIPSLGAVISFAGPAVPRYYSVASSPSKHPTKIAIAFSVVHYISNASCKPDQSIRRAGLCTSYLEWTASKFLYADVAGVDVRAPLTPALRIFHKSNVNFRLPGSVAPPLILIGPGTGVAPFIGFLQHRKEIEKARLKSCDDACEGLWRGGFEIEEEDLPGESSQVKDFINMTMPGPVYPYFGCRNEDDYLYKDQLQTFLSNGTLHMLEVARSRVTAEKFYVTHILKEHGKELARLLLNDGAYVYVCGDGNQMAKDVNNALMQALIEHGGLTEALAIEKIASLKLKRRYVLDIWS